MSLVDCNIIMEFFPVSLNVNDYLNLSTLNSVESFEFYEVPTDINISNGFGKRCKIFVTQELLTSIRNKQSKLRIVRMGSNEIVNDVIIFIYRFTGSIQVLVGSSGKIFIGNCGQLNIDFRLGHEGIVVIGDQTTCNGARIVAVKSTIDIKKDSMLSDEILIQGFDQHGIVDLKTREIINGSKNTVTIGKHTWIGRRVTLMPGISVGDGSIVGACSVVTGNVPTCSAVAGVPARVIQNNVSWCRPWTHIDEASSAFFDSI